MQGVEGFDRISPLELELGKRPLGFELGKGSCYGFGKGQSGDD